MREVRSNRGLAYSTFGLISLGRNKGIFFNFCQTKSQSVGEAIKLMKDIITDMTENPVTSEELEGFPDDYLETYLPRIKKVDADKVLAIGKRAVDPDNMVILVVGKKAEIIDQLNALGLLVVHLDWGKFELI